MRAEEVFLKISRRLLNYIQRQPSKDTLLPMKVSAIFIFLELACQKITKKLLNTTKKEQKKEMLNHSTI